MFSLDKSPDHEVEIEVAGDTVANVTEPGVSGTLIVGSQMHVGDRSSVTVAAP